MSLSTTTGRVYNFSAGPAVLPLPVLEQIAAEMVCLPGAGCSLLEISHRDPAYDNIHQQTIADLTELLSIPETHQVLLLQGGARLQFSMIPMNLLPPTGGTCDYLVTGSWGKGAVGEAEKLGQANVVWTGAETNFDRVPKPSEVALTPNASYLHYTSNETIQGVQFQEAPECGDVPLVVDASSELLSKSLDVSKFGLIYACAQKNAGPAGVTTVIIRKDLLERSQDSLPGYMNYKKHADANSLFNTPPAFGIYVMGLVAKWLRDEMGGLEAIAEINRRKAAQLYQVIDSSNGFYLGHAQPNCRSMMNVAFRTASTELDAEFIKSAKESGLATLKGHRSVGGMRASIYNAMPEAGVNALAEFMKDFAANHAD